MIFDVIKSAVGVDKWGEKDGKRTLSFEVVPNDRDRLEIGEKYVVASAGFHRMLHRDRERVSARVFLTSERSYIEWEGVRPEKDVIGWASVSQDGDLTMMVLVEPPLFDELFKLRITAPDVAKMHIGIEDLKFGPDMDGSLQVWSLSRKRSDWSSERKPIKSFWIKVETFSTTEGQLATEVERKRNLELAESFDPEERKLAAELAPVPTEDAATKLLRQCRLILLALLVLVAVAVFTR